MRNYLFEINTQNAYTLAEKYNLSEYDRDYIRQNFWPIIKVNNYDTKAIKEKLSTLKNEFIKDNTIFDLEIFNRENTDLLVYELNQYIDILKRGKVEIWEEYGDDFFYIFKMESDIKENTLFISDKNITQVEIYFKNILGIITNHNESESLEKNDSKITDIQYKSYVKSIKDYILNENKNSIESFKFEQIDPLKYLSKDKQLKKLNELINKFYELLNVGYPFVAYNFVNNVFDEENFFSNIPLSIMTNEEVLNIDEIEFNEEIKGFINDYARAKFLELLLSERELVLNPVNDPINFTNARLAELEKIKTIKKSKKLNFDITDEVDDFEVFSKNFETEIATLFNQNISKNEKLNIYYKDYLPKYLSRVNNIVSQIEEMENDFKINFPELETDLKSLNEINSKFKKSILNDLETALNKVLKIDYEKLLFEYLNITNKLETDLKLEGKEISAFFKIFYDRMLHIKSNPKPRQLEIVMQEQNKMKDSEYKPCFNEFLKSYLKPKNVVHSIIKRILKNEVSKFEVISEVNSITNNETTKLFNAEFKKTFDFISSEFLLGINDEDIIQAVEDSKKSGKENLPYTGFSEQELERIKYFTRSINGIDCYFNAFNLGNSTNPKLKQYLFLNDLMIEYKPAYEFTGKGKDFEEYYASFGDLRFLKEILNYIENKESQRKSEPDTSTIEETFFINEFDNVNEKDIIEYFTKNLVEKRHLTKETLIEYLKQAFELKTVPKQKFSFKNINTKENIVSIFYKYYKETAGKPHGKQTMYLDLLKIYFNGFEKINIRNFSK